MKTSTFPPKCTYDGHLVNWTSDKSQVIIEAVSVENYVAVSCDLRLRIIKRATPLIKRRVEMTSAWVG